MKKKTVTIGFEIPDEISDEDFEEWIEFELGWSAGCSGKNRLLEKYCVSDFETNFDVRNW